MLPTVWSGFQLVAVFVDSDRISDSFLNGFDLSYFFVQKKMLRDKDNSASERVSLDISDLRVTRKVLLRHLIDSLREAQEIIDSDTEHSQKTIMKVLGLKTRINGKLNKVKETAEKIFNGLELKILRGQ